MKRTIKIFAVAPLILLILFLGILSIKYSPVYVYRLVTQNVADVYDYRYYENRIIKGADTAFAFINSPDESFVEGLFHSRVSRSGFKDFDEWAEKSQTTALIFIRDDTILFEKYFNGFSRDSYFHSQSMAKSFISFLTGAAIGDGFISGEDDPMTDYVPELFERDARFAKITIKHLLEMRSGLKYNTSFIPGTNIHAPWHDEALGYYHPNVRKLLLKRVEIGTDPGGDFQYCNYNTSYLGLIIERATGRTVSEYLEEKLWSETMEYDALFSLDSRKSGFEYMPSRLMARAIDYARFGRLYLEQGNWNGNQIISADWGIKSTHEDKSSSRSIFPAWFEDGCKSVYYSYHWWGHSNCDSTFHYAASGNLGQTIYVIPDREIIIVHCGNSLEHYGDYDLWRLTEELKSQEESRADPAGYED